MTKRANKSFTEIEIRVIEPSDISAMGTVIRTVMTEFGAVGEGFSIQDPEVDDMCESYAGHRARYFVAIADGVLLGGAGFAQLQGAQPWTCELRKMYLLAESRGLGLGRRLLQLCLEQAAEFSYTECYLETLGHMDKALGLYAKYGFEPLAGPLGRTGHHGCDTWLLKKL